MKMTVSIVAALIAGTLLFPSSAYAVDCSITNTGPGSENECVVKDRCDVEIDNDTDIDIDNSNNQGAENGNGTTEGNTTGGDAASGNTGNSNGTQVEVEVGNGTPPLCVPGTTTTPPPATGGGGEVEGASTSKVAAAQVEAPVGGVGAGAGGLVLPLLGASVLSAVIGAKRLRALNYDS